MTLLPRSCISTITLKKLHPKAASHATSIYHAKVITSATVVSTDRSALKVFHPSRVLLSPLLMRTGGMSATRSGSLRVQSTFTLAAPAPGISVRRVGWWKTCSEWPSRRTLTMALFPTVTVWRCLRSLATRICHTSRNSRISCLSLSLKRRLSAERRFSGWRYFLPSTIKMTSFEKLDDKWQTNERSRKKWQE